MQSDHLGNNRANFCSSFGAGNATQKDDYYLFGLVASQPITTSPGNQYIFNKKENEVELNQYDFGTRFYDPLIGRWTTVDPQAEKYSRQSLYNYSLNNPINYTAPDGDTVKFVKGTTSQFIIDYLKARKHIKDHHVDGNLSILENSEEVYYIGKTAVFNGFLQLTKIKMGISLEGNDTLESYIRLRT